jgi:hypothetical protein
MDELKLVRAKGAAMHSLGILINHDREALMQILTFVKEHLLEKEAQATKAMFLANEVVRKARYGKA